MTKQQLVKFMVMLVLLPALLAGIAPAKASEAALWQAIRDGRAFAMMRHALAPGTGDPARFDVNDCSTQRNLNDVGRAQAARTGDAFRANGIAAAQVMTSAWCRCQDTASALKLGQPVVLPALNSFFQNRPQRTPQTNALKQWLKGWSGERPLVLVTHQVNISALTGEFASSGEIVVVQRDMSGGVTVLGAIAP